MGYMEATESLKYCFLITRDTSPLKDGLESLQAFSIRRMPGDRNLLSLDASLAIPTRVLRFEDSGLCRRTSVRPVLLTGHTGLALLQHRLRFFGLGFVDQPRNPVVFW
jgi:hypothetical protein